MFNRQPFYPNRQKVFRMLSVMVVIGLVFLGLDRLGTLNWLRSIGERVLVLPVKQLVYDRRVTRCADNSNGLSVNSSDITLQLKVDQLTEENNRFSKLLGISPAQKNQYIKTKVIGVGGGKLVISGGVNQGVRVGMISVVGEENLIYVGKVVKVTPNQGEIALASDYDNRLSVVIVPKDNPNNIIGRGLMIGRGVGQIIIDQILNQEIVRKDDLVAYQYADQLLFIGSISDVKIDVSGVFKSASVIPIVNMESLVTLFLIDK